ncbi:MAG: hypothetical protein LBS27_02270 [Bifidobacteriaceae bacterium]|nr:hypothetical protein [Bifidobacteriaceae bacterium]
MWSHRAPGDATRSGARLVGRARLGRFAATLLGVSLLVAGCGGGGSSVVSAGQIKADARALEAKGYVEQAAMMKDGVITAEELQDSYDLLRDCIAERGFDITAGPYISPVDGLSLEFTMGVPGGSETPISEDDDSFMNECQERYFLDLHYDYANSHPPQMDPPLKTATRECLADRGYETTGEEKSVRDFVGEAAIADPTGSGRDDAVVHCMREVMADLYADRSIAGGSIGW